MCCSVWRNKDTHAQTVQWELMGSHNLYWMYRYCFPLPSVALFRRLTSPCVPPWAECSVCFVIYPGLTSYNPVCSLLLCFFSSLFFFPQGDRGGHLTLQKRWTSFLKARLTCSLPEYDFHFNMLRSMFVMPGNTPQDTLFYGIFGLEWWVSDVKISGWQELWGCKCKWVRRRWKAAINTLR